MKTELLCVMILVGCIEAAVNLDDVLTNDRLLKQYYNCFVEVGSCPKGAGQLKKDFPRMLRTKCRKCTSPQREKIRKAVVFLQENKPEMWEGLLDKYDPTRELSKNMLTDPEFLGRS